MDTANQNPYWSVEPAALAASLGTALTGLTSARAAEEFALNGPNSVEDAPQLGALRMLLRQFASPLVLILVFAALISLLLKQWIDSAIILCIVLGSGLLSFFQEHRASAAVEELKKRLALTCRVVRDGTEQDLPVGMVVPGDLILLSAGNLIPADGIVVEASDFLVTEASMTGESFPVEKRPGVIRAEAPFGSGPIAFSSAHRSAAERQKCSPSGRAAGPNSEPSLPVCARGRQRRISHAVSVNSDTCSFG
jgi:Mg2+-importing ATPase